MALRKDNPNSKSCPKKSGKRGFSMPIIKSISQMPPTKPPRKEAEAGHVPERIQADTLTRKDDHIQKNGAHHNVPKF